MPTLIIGYMYRIRTVTPPQKLPREHCMTYLGNNAWNARPFAGTQEIDPDTIVKLDPIRDNPGRESKAHYMNRVVRDA